MNATTFLDLMSILRHDFLNHLQVISGLVQLNKTDRVKEYIKQVSLEMERLSKISRLVIPEVAEFLMVAHYLACNQQVRVTCEINTRIDHSPVPGNILTDVLEEAFGQSLACLAPPGAASRNLKISVTESDKKYILKISFPDPPPGELEKAQSVLAGASRKMAPYRGKVGIGVSGSGGEIFILFPQKLPEQDSYGT